MIETLQSGGFMMIPILLGSLLAVTIILERFVALARPNVLPMEFVIRLDEMMKSGRFQDAMTACKQNKSSISKVLIAGLENIGRPKQDILEALQMAGRREAANLSKWVGMLGAIAALEPLMGLLGTVLGLIRSFQDVEVMKVVGNPSVVAAGVWQALITTAAGLMIAIPTYAFYRFFRGRISNLVMEMEQGSFYVLQRLAGQQKTD